VNVASEAGRDAVAEFLGNILVFLFGDASRFGAIVIVLVGVYLLWRVSLMFGPMKLCWRCKGKGHVGGWFGGRAKCSRCQGEGVRPRAGGRK
jgi:hypothetical protein